MKSQMIARMPLSLLSLLAALLICSQFSYSVQANSQTLMRDGQHRRSLLSFKEKKGNASFQCSPSGPCVACQYSEKNDEKFRCSETSYRIPLQCVEIGGNSKQAKGKHSLKRRSFMEDTHFTSHPNLNVNKAFENVRKLASSVQYFRPTRLLDASFEVEGGKRTYITYRSCIPAEDEEKLSVLRFEAIMLCLLMMSGTVVYFRRKRTVNVPGGAVRIQTNSRF